MAIICVHVEYPKCTLKDGESLGERGGVEAPGDPSALLAFVSSRGRPLPPSGP